MPPPLLFLLKRHWQVVSNADDEFNRVNTECVIVLTGGFNSEPGASLFGNTLAVSD